MKQLERAQLSTVKGGGAFLTTVGGILNFLSTIVITTPTIVTQNTTTSTQTNNSTKNKKKNKK